MTTIPVQIAAARLRLVRERPYLAAALWSLQPVPRLGLGTLAVDRWWRLYFDPAVCSVWSTEQIAGVLYHEVLHLLRVHHARSEAQGADPRVFNVAGDAEINDDLLSEGISLPGQPVTPATLGQPEGRLAEEYYDALSQVQKSASERGTSAQSDPEAGGEPSASGEDGGDGSEAGTDRQGDGHEAGQEGSGSSADADGAAQDTASAGTPGSTAENGSTPSSTAEGSGQADGAQAGAGGDASSSQAGGAPGSAPGAPSAHGGASFQPPTGSVTSGVGGTQGTASAQSRAQTSASGTVSSPRPGEGSCGSCAHGRQEPWEDGPPGTPGAAPGLRETEAELVRRQVAEEIRIAVSSRDRGVVPEHLRRWADERLRPTRDWRRELASAVRAALASASGAADYTYRRPSRRQSAVPDVVLPSTYQPLPEVAVVVDTSGSVSDGQLSRSLAEVAGILRASGQRHGVRVLAVDEAVQTCRRVFRPEQVELRGGGGTDMGAGIEAALRLRPRPEVVVVITDGYTPWPGEPPRGVRVVVALHGDGNAPGWARVVKCGVK